MDQERIFLSAVSGEFRTARENLARTLRGLALVVREESDFRAEPGSLTLLDKLDAYIEDCGCVVSLIGTRSGSKPQPSEAAAHRDKLPDGIDRTTCPDWSYTQWEVFFALHHNRSLVPLQAAGSYVPDETGVSDKQQSRFVTYLQSRGIDLTIKPASADQFQIEALRALWRGGLMHKPVQLPFLSIGRLFTGRDEFLDRIRASLLPDNGGASAVVSSVYGMGGIGKTRAAVEYALRYYGDYTALLFVRAPDGQTLTDEFAALTGVLRLPEHGATDIEQRRAAVLRWLADHRGWLLIVDNVDTAEAVRAANEIVSLLHGGHVLLTSRLDDAFQHGVESLELGLLTLDDAVAYLLKATEHRRRPEPEEAAQAVTLAEALDRLTLALVHAGAYIAERRITFSRYLEVWKGKRAEVLDWARPEKTGYPVSLAQTWLTSMEQLTEPGRSLLERLSFFANDSVPEFLLDVSSSSAGTAEGLEPLMDLQRYSLATGDAASDRFAIHRIVRDVTNSRLATNAAAHKTRLAEALNWINSAFEGDPQDVLAWSYLDPLAPHAETLAWAADEAGIAMPTARLMNQLAVLFRAKSAHGRAERLFRRALAINEASLEPDHLEVATALSNLAALLLATNRLAEVEPLLRRALAINEASLGAHSWPVAICLNNLATLLHSSNRRTEAEPLFRRALSINEAKFGSDHLGLVTPLNNLAQLLADTNRPAEAEELFRRALAIAEMRRGSDHPDVATGLNNLALLLRTTNRLVEAERLFRRALAITEASLDTNHPTIAIRLNNLALVLLHTGRLTEAEPLLHRALKINTTMLGPDHPTVAHNLTNIAWLLEANGRPEEAEPLYRRALAIDEASFGPDHPIMGLRLSNLASLLVKTSRSQEAIPLLSRAMAISGAKLDAE